MTCLYCGKKLGFFSRYKDTPFCSEEHLRSHQDELEQALMERLGSKASASSSVSAGAPIPIADRPIGKKAQAVTVEKAEKSAESREPASLCEEFFGDFPKMVSHLRVNQPQLPSSSFAIIVQADCCTPSTPDPDQSRALQFDPEEFYFDADGVAQFGLEGSETPEAPSARGAEVFGEPWLLFPDSGPFEIFTDFGASVEMEPLEYDAVPEAPPPGALGHRDAVTPRPRNRFPYAASELSSAFNRLEGSAKLLDLSGPNDWDAVEPAVVVREEGPGPELPQVVPFTNVSLSIAALVEMSLGTADLDWPAGVMEFNARALKAGEGLYVTCASSPIALNPILPGPAISGSGARRPVLRSWARRDGDERVPPLPFPSLFQLGPVLPPRPESAGRQ